ncbi:MAG: PhnD/SsuA/transferrin family substrate-binding protein [Caldilineaceae bacterium]
MAFTKALAQFLQNELSLPVQWIGDEHMGWSARLDQVTQGQIHVGWICGLHYVRLIDGQLSDLELLAAPVQAAPRYAAQPVYFSDLVVRADAGYTTTEALRASTWAYNEPGSLSGRLSMLHFLATAIGVEGGDAARFFGRVVESGGHAHSLKLLLDGQIDCAAIDSTLLDYLLRTDPTLADQIRVLHTLGPFPMPPLVMHRRVPGAVRRRIRNLLLEMHHSPAGRRLLALADLSHFVARADADYDPVRRMSKDVLSIEC